MTAVGLSGEGALSVRCWGGLKHGRRSRPDSELILFDGTSIRQTQGRVSVLSGSVFTAGIRASRVGSEADPVDLTIGEQTDISDN